MQFVVASIDIGAKCNIGTGRTDNIHVCGVHAYLTIVTENVSVHCSSSSYIGMYVDDFNDNYKTGPSCVH